MKRWLLPLLLALSLTAAPIKGILAITWFPSVCKVHHYPACKKPLPSWLTNFTIHGLWPSRAHYCHVSPRAKILDKRGLWEKIPLDLPPSLTELLYLYMPGALSGLHKHEWIKHGSCYTKNPQEYFLDSIALTSKINQSLVKAFFLDHRGKVVQTYKIRKVFDKAFGKGSGKRVKFICKRGYITEMRISLKGFLSPNTPLGKLLRHAPKLRIGCKRGKIATGLLHSSQ